LLEDPDLRNRIAAAGREKVEHEFNLETECRRFATIMTTSLPEDDEAA